MKQKMIMVTDELFSILEGEKNASKLIRELLEKHYKTGDTDGVTTNLLS